MTIQFVGLPSDDVARIKREGVDAYGLPIEQRKSDGEGTPCRHCLDTTPKGDPYLTLAYRPFRGLNPYTETGPVFLCAGDCASPGAITRAPAMLTSARYIVRGYTADERISYGTGGVVETRDIAGRAAEILSDAEIAFVDIRSAANNCYQCRVVRAKRP